MEKSKFYDMIASRFTEADLKEWHIVVCIKKGCGWNGLSRDTDGGEQIADTGDYDDMKCPKCGERSIDDFDAFSDELPM